MSANRDVFGKENFMQVTHIGKEFFATQNGDVFIEFAPGETREVDDAIGALLLSTTRETRRFSKNAVIAEQTKLFIQTERGAGHSKPNRNGRGRRRRCVRKH